MIKNKADLKRYIELDRYALNRGGEGRTLQSPVIFGFDLEISSYTSEA